MVPVKSTRPRMRSYAYLSIPVVSITPRGVAKSRERTSFLMSRSVGVLSATDSVVHPKPDCLGISVSFLDSGNNLVLNLGKLFYPELRLGVGTCCCTLWMFSHATRARWILKDCHPEFIA